MSNNLGEVFEGACSAEIHAEIHFSDARDIPAVLEFYRGNRHQHVHIRDEKLLSDLVRDGQFLILKDKDNGEILASSGTYPYKVAGDTDQPSFREIGSTRFSEKVAGFGLYPLFISSQVIHSTLTDPCKNMFIANVYDDSPVGRNLLTKKAGWKVVEATPDILEVFKATKDQDAAKDKAEKPMTWYGSPPSCMPHQASVILDFIKNKSAITHKRGDMVLHIDYGRFDLARAYRPHLEKLALMAGRDDLRESMSCTRALDVPQLRRFIEGAVARGQAATPRAMRPVQK